MKEYKVAHWGRHASPQVFIGIIPDPCCQNVRLTIIWNTMSCCCPELTLSHSKDEYGPGSTSLAHDWANEQTNKVLEDQDEEEKEGRHNIFL